MRTDIETFEASVRLFRSLGETLLKSGHTLAEDLKLGGEVSLWDVVAPYETLYRLPTFIGTAADALSPRQQASRRLLWMVRRLGAHVRNNAAPLPLRMRPPEAFGSGRRTLMFLGFAPLFYRDVLAAVAAEFCDRDDYQCLAVTLRPSGFLADLLRGGSVRQRSIYDYWGQRDQAEYDVLLGRLAAVRGLALNLTETKLPYEGIGLPVNQALLQDELSWLFWSEFKRLIPLMVGARSIITNDKPAMIITADDADQRSRAFCLTARTLGVPTLVVQQGITSAHYPEWKFFGADRIAAMGPKSRDALVAQGVSADKITITGHPGFDCLIAPAADEVAATRSACSTPSGLKMVVFASQPGYVGAFSSNSARREMIKAVLEAAEKTAGMILILKPHPSESLSEIKALAKPFRQTNVVDQKIPIAKLIAACDVFVTFFSQTGIEALIAGKPVINVRFPGSTGESYYIETGATCLVQTADELQRQLARLTGMERNAEMALREAAKANLLREWTYLNDGHSARRVGRLIADILGAKTALPAASPVRP